jgi:hypothetical protein
MVTEDYYYRPAWQADRQKAKGDITERRRQVNAKGAAPYTSTSVYGVY